MLRKRRRAWPYAAARLVEEGQALQVTTGPATNYWKTDATALVDFTFKATLAGSGKLKSTNGYYGLRFAHDTDVLVSDWPRQQSERRSQGQLMSPTGAPGAARCLQAE